MSDQEKEKGARNMKKARTFDFMTMFQEARTTAMNRCQGSVQHTTDNTEPAADSSSSEGDSSEGSDSESSSDTEAPTKSADMESKKAITNNDKKKKKEVDDNDEDDDDFVGPPLPPSMKNAITNSKEEDVIGPPLPPSMRQSTHKSDDEDDDEEEEEEESLSQKIPSSNEISLNHGSKVVSALCLDPSGARLVTGGHDFEVKFWDFAGMDASLQSFRSIKPCESHHIKQLEYNATGEMILVVSGNSKAKVLDRDGFEIMECMKGDPYLVDMASTKGHTAMLNSGCWNPKIREEFMTCSNDGSVRLWDVESQGKRHKNIMKPKSQQGRKIVPTACAYSPDGRWVAAACQDGSIQVWDHNKFFVNVAMTNRNCHMNGSDISCLCFSYDGKTLASRGGDDTLKLWDIRNFKKPLNTKDGLTNFYTVTDCVFSPNDRMIITGVSIKKNQGHGKLFFLERETLDVVSELEFAGTSVVRSLWHPKLNQIVVGCSDGQARLFYDEKKSHRGAMLCVVKQPRKSKQVLAMASQQVITPYALPMFRQGRPTSTKKQEEKVRKDPLKSKRPELPITGPGEGGRVGAKGATLSQYVVQSLVKRKPDKYENDPRAAILRHAKDAEENPLWIDPAYRKTQPVKIFQNEEDEDEEKDDDEPVWKKTKI